MKKENDKYDGIIVGGGPAGLSAAIYMAGAGYRVLVVEKERFGGRMGLIQENVNYPGIRNISGEKLAEEMQRQAEAMGAEFLKAEALSLQVSEVWKTVHTSAGDKTALGMILAPGAAPRRLGFIGEEKYQWHGIAYHAAIDGRAFAGKEVFVIGGSFTAVEEAMFLTRYARRVSMIIREEDYSCVRSVSDQLKRYEKIKVYFQTELLEAGGEGQISYVCFRNRKTKEEWRFDAEEGEFLGVFLYAGYEPATSWLKGVIEMDEQGYILTYTNRRTSADGIYAAGDVCIKNLKQTVTAAADGAVAAVSLEKYTAAVCDMMGSFQVGRA